MYFVVGNADELYEFHRAGGVTIVEAPADTPWELRDYRILDLDGYELVFGHRLPEAGPPIKIEREELKKKHGIDYDTHASYRFVE